jgi:hypothetical protein
VIKKAKSQKTQKSKPKKIPKVKPKQKKIRKPIYEQIKDKQENIEDCLLSIVDKIVKERMKKAKAKKLSKLQKFNTKETIPEKEKKAVIDPMNIAKYLKDIYRL